MCGTCAAASGVLTVMRTSSEPARASSLTWLAVPRVGGVGVGHRLHHDRRVAADEHVAHARPGARSGASLEAHFSVKRATSTLVCGRRSTGLPSWCSSSPSSRCRSRCRTAPRPRTTRSRAGGVERRDQHAPGAVLHFQPGLAFGAQHDAVRSRGERRFRRLAAAAAAVFSDWGFFFSTATAAAARRLLGHAPVPERGSGAGAGGCGATAAWAGGSAGWVRSSAGASGRGGDFCCCHS